MWDGWLIAGNTHGIIVMQKKLIHHGYIHFKTIAFFKSFHTFSKHNKIIFAATAEYFKQSPTYIVPYLLMYKSTFYNQKIALDLYTSHTRPDKAVQEISITIP